MRIGFAFSNLVAPIHCQQEEERHPVICCTNGTAASYENLYGGPHKIAQHEPNKKYHIQSGLPYRNAVERAYRQGSLSAGRGGAFRVLGIRFRPDRRYAAGGNLPAGGRYHKPSAAAAKRRTAGPRTGGSPGGGALRDGPGSRCRQARLRGVSGLRGYRTVV